MKIILYIGISLILMGTFSSCETMFGDYLDKPPGIDITEDVIFSDKEELLTFIAGIYYYGIPPGYPNKQGAQISGNIVNTGGAADEGDVERSWYPANDWNRGSIGPGAIRWHEDSWFLNRWDLLRRIHTVMDRIDDVPGLTTEEKNQFVGEVLFLRGLANMEMLQRYGSFPIVDRRLNPGDDLMISQSTVTECVNFIVQDAEEAARLLPDINDGSMKGRATKGAALMLKSRVLLFSASPMFNTDTPYLDHGEHNNLISHGNYDVKRWEMAADAAKAVIDWAPSGGVRLITEHGPDKNYKYVWEVPDNEEIILADKSRGGENAWSMWPWGYYVPPPIYGGQAGVSIPMNHIMKYERRDGTWQEWDMENGGNDLSHKYAELDYRFHQSIAYNGAYWNHEFPVVETFVGGRHTNRCLAGTWLRKGIPDALTRSVRITLNWTVFRLAEAYLNYAEALNEAYGPVQEAHDAINKIRNRSGQPDLPADLTQEEFRNRVRNERAIELFFEDHRFWDIRRWLIAEDTDPITGMGIMQGEFWGFRIYEIEDSDEFRYEPYIFKSRIFRTQMYLHPWWQNEVNKGYLIQNPGYAG